jgi:hypothetical protein
MKLSRLFPHVTCILSQCSEWESLSKPQSDSVIREIPALTNITLLYGRVSDYEIESHLSRQWHQVYGKTKSDSMAVSRLRAVWGNHEACVGMQVELAHHAEEEAINKQKRQLKLQNNKRLKSRLQRNFLASNLRGS